MLKVIIRFIFTVRFFEISNCYVLMYLTDTDNGYCEYQNGVLIPVNDYAFDVEKCERIECNPGEIIIRGCGVYATPLYPGLNCTLVRGKGFGNCCETIPKCKVLFKFPGNNSYPKDWIIEDDGTAKTLFRPPIEEDMTEEDTTDDDMTYEYTAAENTTGKTVDPLLSEINRQSRNYPIS